jgi:2-oxoglutarate dehydrogenase E2 component (dihydrolipoamide succinyltransferase)
MPTKILVPELGESVVEATVAVWHKKQGDRVAAGQVLVELETDKVNLEVGAERAGVLARIERREGEDVKPGDVLGVIEESAEPAAAAPQPAPAIAQPKESTRGDGRDQERATPVAARFAQDQGVDLSQVAASAPGARVTKQDVEQYLAQHKPAVEEKPAQQKQAVEEKSTKQKQTQGAPAPAPHRAEREERVRMTRRRRTIAERLVHAHQTAAMLTTFNEIDMSAVIEIRERRKEAFKEAHGVGLGFMSFFVKATIGALKQFPRLNAEIDGDEIVLKHFFDIGIAVGAEEGLVVPVLRDADRMSFAGVEQAIKDVVQKSQAGTLSLDDLRGGTFTITNGGVFGSMLSTPILNAPQVGILGLHKIEERPIARDGQTVIHPMMYAALSYDHRIVDGREAVQFLVRVKQLIEDPESLLLEG